MPWFLRVSSSSRSPCHGFLTIVSVHDRVTHSGGTAEKINILNFNLISRRCPLELDQIVVGAVGGEQGAGVLEVLALCFTLQRPVARLEKPVCEKDAPVGSGERVVLPFGQVVFIIKPLVHLRARQRRVRLEQHTAQLCRLTCCPTYTLTWRPSPRSMGWT